MVGYKKNHKGRSTGRIHKSLNSPPKDKGWFWIPHDMAESEAFRCLSINAINILFRLILEHSQQQLGQENGNLICTYTNFADYGATRQYIRAALEELKLAGLIRYKAGKVNGNRKPSHIYTLTFFSTFDGVPATNDWKGRTGKAIQEQLKEYKKKLKCVKI